MDAFLRHYDIDFQIAEGLQAQWGGSLKAIAAFADEAVTRTRPCDAGDKATAKRLVEAIKTNVEPSWSGRSTFES